MLLPLSRRDWLTQTGCGFGAMALAGLASQSRAADAAKFNPLAAKLPHFAPKAKRVIFLFMQGGVSHVDSFDYKPRLDKDDGKQFGFDDARALANTGARGTSQRVMKPLWKFAKPVIVFFWYALSLPLLQLDLGEAVEFYGSLAGVRA